MRAAGVIKAIGAGLNETERSLRFARDTDIDCILLAGRYTMLEQDSLDDLLPFCQEKDISIVLGGPFNSGILATQSGAQAKFDYGPVPDHIAERVRSLHSVGERHSVNLIATALQFPLAHDAVASVIPGAVKVAEQTANLAAMAETIPADYWRELKDQGLLRADAPVPD